MEDLHKASVHELNNGVILITHMENVKKGVERLSSNLGRP
jgi:hypothetical protein